MYEVRSSHFPEILKSFTLWFIQRRIDSVCSNVLRRESKWRIERRRVSLDECSLDECSSLVEIPSILATRCIESCCASSMIKLFSGDACLTPEQCLQAFRPPDPHARHAFQPSKHAFKGFELLQQPRPSLLSDTLHACSKENKNARKIKKLMNRTHK